MFLNTCGEDEQDVPKELVSFLKFVHADLKESQEDFEDDYVRQVQKSVTPYQGKQGNGGEIYAFGIIDAR